MESLLTILIVKEVGMKTWRMDGKMIIVSIREVVDQALVKIGISRKITKMRTRKMMKIRKVSCPKCSNKAFRRDKR
jgi:hypothetical protein